MVLARTASLAWPLAAVVTTAPPGKVAPAPLPGAAKVTLTPDTGLPNWSLTVATSGAAKAVLTVALCGVPEATTMLAAAPAVLVRLNDAGLGAPVKLAVTV